MNVQGEYIRVFPLVCVLGELLDLSIPRYSRQ